MSQPTPTAVVFDLGGVLIDWNPRYLYRTLFKDDEAAMERFLAEVTTPEWNHRQDQGRPWSEAIAELTGRHPHQRELIEAYHARWQEMLGGPMEATVEVLAQLRDEGRVRLFALSNWSSETYAIARPGFPFLGWFEAVVISGELGIAKPEPAIFEHLLRRHDLEAESTVYVDDIPANVEAAARLGFRAIHFRDAVDLRRRLEDQGLLLTRRTA
jgi:2-haloacid dehalogenase